MIQVQEERKKTVENIEEELKKGYQLQIVSNLYGERIGCFLKVLSDTYEFGGKDVDLSFLEPYSYIRERLENRACLSVSYENAFIAVLKEQEEQKVYNETAYFKEVEQAKGNHFLFSIIDLNNKLRNQKPKKEGGYVYGKNIGRYGRWNG